MPAVNDDSAPPDPRDVGVAASSPELPPTPSGPDDAPPLVTDLDRPAALAPLLAIAFLGSVSNGAFFAGLFFVTAERYQFSPVRNLVLGLAVGLVTVSGSRSAASVARIAPTPRALLRSALGLWGLMALVPLAFGRHESMLWVGALGGVACSSMVWPVVESYLTAGRHGPDMRFALGGFNMAWSLATVVPLLLMPLLARWDSRLSLAMGAGFSAVAVVVAGRLPVRPPAHQAEAAHAALGREYPALMRSASWLLPASYVISSALSPVLPQRIAEVTGSLRGAGPLAATWMLARFAALAVMWRLPGWHGRWATLGGAAAGLLLGLGLVLLATDALTLGAGLALFGLGMGTTYAAAVYYSMSVGHAAVDAGGNFEALIGLGYCGGPLLGLAAYLGSGPARASSTTVLLMWLAAALAAPGALRPYWRARARRREQATPPG
jgi:hypothetical protein